jgi:DNA modification methylase
VSDGTHGGAWTRRRREARSTGQQIGGRLGNEPADGQRNARTVWTIATQPYSGSHFATFPEELARRCILAGSRPDDTVLDPFGGSGTTASVAVGHGRRAIHIDLNPAYLELARQRIGPMLCVDAVPEAA